MLFLIFLFFTTNAIAETTKISETQYQETVTVNEVVDMDAEQAGLDKAYSDMAASDAEAQRVADYYTSVHKNYEKIIAEHQANLDAGKAVGADVTPKPAWESPPL